MVYNIIHGMYNFFVGGNIDSDGVVKGERYFKWFVVIASHLCWCMYNAKCVYYVYKERVNEGHRTTTSLPDDSS